MHPIDKYGIYKIVVYEGFDEQYYTFCTPEARLAIDAYLDFRRRFEKVTPDSWLFRRDFDPQREIEAATVKRATDVGLRYAISNLMVECGVRPKVTLTEGKEPYLVQHEMKVVHGLRKFFDTQTTLSGISPLWVEMFDGHDIKLKESYFKPTEADLLEGNDKMHGYTAAIDALTINEENRLKKRVAALEQTRDKVEEMYQYYLKMENEKAKT